MFLTPYVISVLPSVSHQLVSEATAEKNREYFVSTSSVINPMLNSDSLLAAASIKDSLLANDLQKEDKVDEKQMDIEDALFCFKYLLVFNAACKSFAHGIILLLRSYYCYYNYV